MKHLYFLTLLLTFTSCLSVPELLDKGRYGEAYELAYKHCTRARAPSPKHLDQFVDAYAAVQARDEHRAATLRERNGNEKWPDLYEIYRELYQRSEDILAIAPGEARFGRYPNLAPAYLEQLREEARKNAGAYYLALAAPLLPAARNGEKPAAREVFDLHRRVAYFLPERNESFAPLRDSMRNIGTLRILLYAPEGEYSAELHQTIANLKPYDKNWTQILNQDYGQRIDLEAEITYYDYSGGNFSESCSTTEHSTEILDYIEKKKVTKRINDSTVVEEVIEIKHFKNVYATVTTCEQSVSVRAAGFITVYLPGSDAPEWRTEVTGGDAWSNSFSFGNGDARALPAFANSGTSRSPPSPYTMVANAVRSIPYHAHRALVKKYDITDKQVR